MSAARDRQLRAARQRHGLRRAGRRPPGLQLRRLERLGGALQRPPADGLLAPARRRQVPDAREPHLRAAAVQGARLPRPARPHLQHDPPDPARARADRDGRLRDGARASRSPRARCCAAPRCTTTTTCTSPSMGFWATWFVQDDSVKRCGRCPTTSSRSTGPKRFDRTPNHDLVGAPARPAARRVHRVRRQRARDRRRLLPAREDHREGRRDRHLALRRRQAAQRHASRTARAASRRIYWGRPPAATASRRR